MLSSDVVIVAILCLTFVIMLLTLLYSTLNTVNLENFEPTCSDTETIEPDEVNVLLKELSSHDIQQSVPIFPDDDNHAVVLLQTKKSIVPDDEHVFNCTEIEKPVKNVLPSPYPDLSRYILKSTIQPCNCPKQESPDPRIAVFSETERSRYILKTEIPNTKQEQNSSECESSVLEKKISSYRPIQQRKRNSKRGYDNEKESGSSVKFPKPLFHNNENIVMPNSDSFSLKYLQLVENIPDIYTQPDIGISTYSTIS